MWSVLAVESRGEFVVGENGSCGGVAEAGEDSPRDDKEPLGTRSDIGVLTAGCDEPVKEPKLIFSPP